MPSPFPGMDPFLESPAVFPDLQQTLVANLSTELNRVLPKPYYSALQNRVGQSRDEFPPADSRPPLKLSVVDGQEVSPVVVDLGWEEFSEIIPADSLVD